jgi:hypothetical protein
MLSKVLRRINARFFRLYAVIATTLRYAFARDVFARAAMAFPTLLPRILSDPKRGSGKA